MPSSRKKKKKSSRSKAASGRPPPKGQAIERRLRRHQPAQLPGKLPRHVAIIMDGNGRWAQSRGLPRVEGHREGARSVGDIVAISREVGIRYLTLYAFSSENWRRPRFEIGALMHLLDEYLYAEVDEMVERGIRLHTVGDIKRIPRSVRSHLQGVVDATARGRKMTLILALSYGARQEIQQMVRRAVSEAQAGRLSPRQVSERWIANHLYTQGIPDPDLLIRTAGEYRLSNFLLWQSAYAELYVTRTFWPDFRRPQYTRALLSYGRRERRYGMTGEQITGGGG